MDTANTANTATQSPQSPQTPAPASRSLDRNVVMLGWVSLFNDAASEMLYPVLPLFVIATLHASPTILGVIDGTAEGIGSALRWLGGVLSDRYRRRKPFVMAGYALSALSKPVMGLAGFVVGVPLFALGRCSDRFGKSVRNAARDALIAASTDKSTRGRAFGFQRAMDTVGAVIGPLVTLGVIIALTSAAIAFSAGWKGGSGASTAGDSLRKLPLKWLFFVALIPGVLTVAFVAAVREIRPRPDEKTKTGGKPPPMFQSYPRPLWEVMVAAFVFSLGNSSDTFLILRSSQIGLTFGYIILAYVIYNIVYASLSEPMGRLSDKIGRKPLLIMGWLTYAGVYAGFALAGAAWAPWVLLGIYGLYQGMTDGVTSALISDVVPDHQRAGAIGLFYAVVGIGQLTGSVVAGVVFNVSVFNGHVRLAFLLGSVLALLAIPPLAMVRVRHSAE